jgi:hypothetical protein
MEILKSILEKGSLSLDNNTEERRALYSEVNRLVELTDAKINDSTLPYVKKITNILDNFILRGADSCFVLLGAINFKDALKKRYSLTGVYSYDLFSNC